MGQLELDQIIGPLAITTLSAFQMTNFARKVGKARSKYKIQPPATDGDENFIRVFRAQQNCVEFYPIFLASLWGGSLLLHQGPPCVLGLVYMIGRAKYFRGYSEKAEDRWPGFRMSLNALLGLHACAGIGLLHFVFVKATGRTVLSFFQA